MKASYYDRLVNWERRLKREWPFYEGIFRGRGVKSILDCACGTGRHAILFAKNGFQVTGTDIDPEMIEQAERNAAVQGADVLFRKAAFSELARVFPSQRFDAVICTGNSLSQLPDIKGAGEAILNMAAVCRPGGLLVLHILNYRSLMKKRLVSQPLRVSGEKDNKLLFQKIFLPREQWVDVIVVKMMESGDDWNSEVTSGRLLPLMPSAVEKMAEAAGFTGLKLQGDYAGAAFDPENSWDLILTATRAS